MRIDPKRLYSTREVIELGVMKAPKKNSQKQMFLRFIRQGRIKVTNVGGDKKPRYIVQGKDLKDYLDRQVKEGEYLTK